MFMLLKNAVKNILGLFNLTQWDEVGGSLCYTLASVLASRLNKSFLDLSRSCNYVITGLHLAYMMHLGILIDFKDLDGESEPLISDAGGDKCF